MNRRIFLIVVDGLGIGEAADNIDPADKGSNTLLHILKATRVYLPTLTKLGLVSFPTISTSHVATSTTYATLNERSLGKDSTVGHWEIAGHITTRAFDTFSNGFPQDIIDLVCDSFGVEQVLCNKPYSGTEAIKHYGDRHISTGFPIVYTSADSCLQIACHDTVVSKDELHYACEYIREHLPVGYRIGRVIARPFTGIHGNFYRTKYRRDYSVTPPLDVLPIALQKAGKEVISVGKIYDLFAGAGITSVCTAKTNQEAYEELNHLVLQDFDGLVFANLSDTDVLYGHRNDVEGYKNCLIDLDNFLCAFLPKLVKNDILIITSDHGNDPYTASTDHSREKVPLLIYGDTIKKNNYLGEIDGFTCISDFIKGIFGLPTNRTYFEKALENKEPIPT